jgi:hypothetical protein
MVVQLSALRAGRPLPHEESWYSFLLEAACGLSVFSVVPQPTTLPRVHLKVYKITNLCVDLYGRRAKGNVWRMSSSGIWKPRLYLTGNTLPLRYRAQVVNGTSDLRFSRRWLWRMPSSGMWLRGSCKNRRLKRLESAFHLVLKPGDVISPVVTPLKTSEVLWYFSGTCRLSSGSWRFG